MLEWKKQVLRNRVISLNETKQIAYNSIENEVEKWVNQMQTYIYKLFSHFHYVANLNQSFSNGHEIEWPIFIKSPQNLNQKEEYRIMATLYRRMKNIAISFQIDQKLLNQVDQIFMNAIESLQFSVTTYFNRCCVIFIDEMGRIIRRKQERYNYDKRISSRIENENKKQQQKIESNNSKFLCNTLYDILDLQEIEVYQLMIEKVGLINNVRYIFQRVKYKNKRARKAINQHILNMQNCKSKKQRFLQLPKKEQRQLNPKIYNSRQKSLLQAIKTPTNVLKTKSVSQHKRSLTIKSKNKKENQMLQLGKQKVKLQNLVKEKQKLKL